MITRITLTTLFIVVSINIYSQVTQEWVAIFNAPYNSVDEANSIAIDNYGNIYVTGESDNESFVGDYATVKYNSLGIQQWFRIYNGPGDTNDIANDIAVDYKGNIIVTGKSIGIVTGYDFATVKYNLAGDVLWVRTFNTDSNSDDDARFISVDGDANVIVCGNGGSDIITIKYDYYGILQWKAIFSDNQNSFDYAMAMTIDRIGNIYVTGESNSSYSDPDCITLKYSSSGKLEWIRRYNGIFDFDDFSNSITIDSIGNVYITGITMEDPWKSECLTIKYDPNGNQKWVATFDASPDYLDYGSSISVDNSGFVYVTGTTACESTYTNSLTIKYDSAGVLQWYAIFDGHGYSDETYSTEIDNCGGIYIAGFTSTNFYDANYLTIKYNSAGQITWAKEYNIVGGANFVSKMVSDSYRNIFVTGRCVGSYGGYNFTTIKYSQPIGIHPISTEIPSQYSISQNYPNPFNPATKIKFALPPSPKGEGLGVRVLIYDILGREIATLVNGQLQPGTYEVEWDGSNYPSGVYLYRIITQEFTETKKMILIK